MAKHTMKENNRKRKREQRLVDYLIPVFCTAFALICIASSITLKHRETGTERIAAVESTAVAEKAGDTEKTDIIEETSVIEEHGKIEEIDIAAEIDRIEAIDTTEASEITEEIGNTEKTDDRPEVDEVIYVAEEAYVSAENHNAEETDDTEADSTEQAEASSYDVSNEVENTELSGKETVDNSAVYSATLKAADGYMLPKSISITMGEDGSELKEFSYDTESGKIKIPAGVVKGNLTLSGSAELIQYYSVTSKISNSILYGTTADTKSGYSATVVPNVGYSLPTQITATVEGEDFTDFTYDAVTGAITVASSAMTGNLVFSGECAAAIQAEKYRIIASIGHGKAEIRKDSTAAAMEIVIVPDTGYACPTELIVISGNKRFTDFIYDNKSGALAIGYGKVSSVIISGVCASKETSVKYLGEKSAIPKFARDQQLGGEASSSFTDIWENDYFYDSVLWATERNITTGTDTLHFSPYALVTRGQVVTFLWRASGCPEPKSSVSKFYDVPAKEYYTKAIAWAIERGITTGVTSKAFCPEDTCTRGQIVTFLARFAGVKDADTKSTFSDVDSTEFFAAAVKWAKDNGVTEGATPTTFAPYADCCRADVVTFLYRMMGK